MRVLLTAVLQVPAYSRCSINTESEERVSSNAVGVMEGTCVPRTVVSVLRSWEVPVMIFGHSSVHLSPGPARPSYHPQPSKQDSPESLSHSEKSTRLYTKDVKAG